MSNKKDQNLNPEEKNEIKNDVKEAIGNAFKGPLNSIDKILKDGPKETLNQEEVDKIVNKQNKKKNSDKKPVIMTIILLIIIAITGISMYFSNNPKTIFIKAIDKTFNTLEKNITPKYEKTKGELTLNLNANTNSNEETNIKLDMNYGIDTKDSLFNADMKITSANEQLIDMKVYSESDKTYIYSENILNKFLELDANLGNKEETKTILTSLNKAITKSIENEKFVGSTMQTLVDGKTIKTYRSSFTLNKDNMETVLNNINDILKQDEKFINAVSKLTNKTKEVTSGEVTDKINEIKKDLANVESLTFNIFTKGAAQKFVKLEINEIINNETNTFSLTNINDNKYQYLIDNKTNSQNMSGNIEYKTEKDKLYLKISSDKSNKTNLSLTLNNKYKKVNEIELVDTKDAVKISELSDNEKGNIISKIFFNS